MTTITSRRGIGLTFTGTVVHGDARGRLLGFPTANLDLGPAQVVPADGVWVAAAEVPDWFDSVPLVRRAALSVGTNPTYGGTRLRIEAHLLDFDGDLYGRRLTIHLLGHVRGTVAFTSEQALVSQIRRDVDETRTWTG